VVKGFALRKRGAPERPARSLETAKATEDV